MSSEPKKSQMRLAVCITTMNAPQDLDTCLRALYSSTVKPSSITVSDDSSTSEMQQKNHHVVEQYPNTTYVTGPQRGVCANRNFALSAAPDAELVAFIDDDVCVAPDFVENAIKFYSHMPLHKRNRTLITGGIPTKLSFQGYYKIADVPRCINVHSSVFPKSFLEEEQWNEAIFFGCEEGELCLRALKRGYHILHCPELKIKNIRDGKSTLKVGGVGALTDYDIHTHAARLYVGIKRYKDLEPSLFKLTIFVILYFSHITIYLLRKGALKALPLIVQRSHLREVLRPFLLKEL